MLLLNLIPLIAVTFSTPTGDITTTISLMCSQLHACH
jgi:F0F1-type ATP synthase membrane subunit a